MSCARFRFHAGVQGHNQVSKVSLRAFRMGWGGGGGGALAGSFFVLMEIVSDK